MSSSWNATKKPGTGKFDQGPETSTVGDPYLPARFIYYMYLCLWYRNMKRDMLPFLLGSLDFLCCKVFCMMWIYMTTTMACFDLIAFPRYI
jgi:hypothetical protein